MLAFSSSWTHNALVHSSSRESSLCVGLHENMFRFLGMRKTKAASDNSFAKAARDRLSQNTTVPLFVFPPLLHAALDRRQDYVKDEALQFRGDFFFPLKGKDFERFGKLLLEPSLFCFICQSTSQGHVCNHWC